MGSRESIAAVIGLRGLPETSRRGNQLGLVTINTNTYTQTTLELKYIHSNTNEKNNVYLLQVKDTSRAKK